MKGYKIPKPGKRFSLGSPSKGGTHAPGMDPRQLAIKGGKKKLF